MEAEDQAQAKKRLRIHIADAEALRPGVVAKQPEQRNSTPERIIAAGEPEEETTSLPTE